MYLSIVLPPILYPTVVPFSMHFSGTVTNSPNGHVASQEELDSVINLLSGVGTGPVNHMSPIPEQQSSVSLQVPSLYGSLSPSTSDSCMDNLSTQRSQSQRRSEGCLDLAGFGNPGRNTWPHQHRSSLPGKFCLPMLFLSLGIMTSIEINRIFEHKIVNILLSMCLT